MRDKLDLETYNLNRKKFYQKQREFDKRDTLDFIYDMIISFITICILFFLVYGAMWLLTRFFA